MKNKTNVIVLIVLFLITFLVGTGNVAAQIIARTGEAVKIVGGPGNNVPNASVPAGAGASQQRDIVGDTSNGGAGRATLPTTRQIELPFSRIWLELDIAEENISYVRDEPTEGRTSIRNPFVISIPRNGFNPNDLPFDISRNIQDRTYLIPSETWGEETGTTTTCKEHHQLPPRENIGVPLPAPETTITRQTSDLVRMRNFETLSYDWTFTNHTTRGGMSPWNRVPHDEAYVTFPTAGRWIVTIHPWNRWELHQYERVVTTTTVTVPPPPSPPGWPPGVSTSRTETNISYEHRGLLRTVEGRHTSRPLQIFRILVIRPNETIRVPNPDQRFFESDFELIR